MKTRHLYRIFSVQLLLFTVLIVPSMVLAQGKAPKEIADIRLGTHIDSYPHFEHSNFLQEIVVMDWHGFRKAVIFYGVCKSPGIIVKLQMKYENSSKAFFNTLLKKYKKQFGDPDEWEGDSFGIKHIWKWRFTDEEGRRVNMVLQHNLEDSNVSKGNQVKLYYPELIEEEHLCFLRQCEESGILPQVPSKSDGKWELLLPQ